MTDFETFTTEAYFDGNIQKLCSILATTVANAFNEQWQLEILRAFEEMHPPARMCNTINADVVESILKCPKAKFDARAWTISDPWEVFNNFKWRQDDATRNAIQMVAQSLYSHKEMHGKNQSMLQEMIFQRGDNFNNYPTKFKRGSFLYKNDTGWFVDTEAPIINQDRGYFFSKLPLLDRPPAPSVKDSAVRDAQPLCTKCVVPNCADKDTTDTDLRCGRFTPAQEMARSTANTESA
jgi:tRNA(His) 5'-end guanylyltransferase